MSPDQRVPRFEPGAGRRGRNPRVGRRCSLAGRGLSSLQQVVFKTRTLGTVEVQLTTAALEHHLDQVRWGIAATILLVVVLLSLCLAFLVRALVLDPLKQLEGYARLVGQPGRSGHRSAPGPVPGGTRDPAVGVREPDGVPGPAVRRAAEGNQPRPRERKPVPHPARRHSRPGLAEGPRRRVPGVQPRFRGPVRRQGGRPSRPDRLTILLLPSWPTSTAATISRPRPRASPGTRSGSPTRLTVTGACSKRSRPQLRIKQARSSAFWASPGTSPRENWWRTTAGDPEALPGDLRKRAHRHFPAPDHRRIHLPQPVPGGSVRLRDQGGVPRALPHLGVPLGRPRPARGLQPPASSPKKWSRTFRPGPGS